jgi:hypothetical protein
MGQLLIVQGNEPNRVGKVFDDACELFHRLCGLKPLDELAGGTVAVAKFPRTQSPTPGIVRGASAGAWIGPAGSWITGAGSYFYRNLSGEAALKGLGQALERPAANGSAPDLRELDGSFAVAAADGITGEVQVVTDRLGSIHIYEARIKSCLVISTSSLVMAALLRPEWDPISCREFLATGTVFEQRTLFQGIEKLGPASVYRFRSGRRQGQAKYWDLTEVMFGRAPFAGNVSSVAAALAETWTTIATQFQRPVLDLTGGFDSRALLGTMLNVAPGCQTVVNGKDGDADVEASKEIAREYGLCHRHQVPSPDSGAAWWSRVKASLALCDGEYDVLSYARTLDFHSRLARDFDVTINGSNGEICKGYWWELLFPFIGWRGHFDDRRLAVGRFAFAGEIGGLLQQEFNEDLGSHFAEVIRKANAEFEEHPNTARMDNIYLTLRMQRWQGRIASATSRVWPCLSPFMFRAPMEMALSAPPSVRVNLRMTRRLIEYLNPKLSRIPLAGGEPAMPLRLSTARYFLPQALELAKKAKRRALGKVFSRPAPARQQPGNGVLQNVLQVEEAREMLEPAGMVTAGLYNRNVLAGVLNSHGAPLGRILTLEMLGRAISTR